MYRLLSIELYKLKYSKAAKILIAIYFGLLTSIALIASIEFDLGPIKFFLANQGIFNFPYIWHFNTYMASVFKVFLLLVIISMMTSEYSYKTLKQNLIDGLSKKEFILSKFYTIIVFALASTLFVFITSLILGLIHSDNKHFSVIFSDLDYFIGFFVKLISFFSLGLLFGILIKKSAFAVAAVIVLYIVENFVIRGYLYMRVGKREAIKSVMQFLPLESMQNLIKEPFTRLKSFKIIVDNMKEEFVKDYSVGFLNIIIVITWTVIFILLSYVLLKKRDL
ncbi:MAG: ABC transporter permease [Tenacibaculum sp.]